MPTLSNQPTHEIRVHLRTLVEPNEDQLSALKRVFKVHGIKINVKSKRKLNNEHLHVVAVASVLSETTEEQDKLFKHAPDGEADTITAFFVQATDPPYWGVSNKEKRCVIVTQGAKEWTLAHEIGHVLGLEHMSSVSQLMVEGGPVNDLVKSVPVIVWPELNKINESSLLHKIAEN